MSRRVKLGFASAIVKAISYLGEISEASSNLNSAEPLPVVLSVVHNKTPNKDSGSKSSNKINNLYGRCLSASNDNENSDAD